MDWNRVWLFLVPILIIEVLFRTYCLVDIHKKNATLRFGTKKMWTLAVALIHFGWVFYLLVGRDDRYLKR